MGNKKIYPMLGWGTGLVLAVSIIWMFGPVVIAQSSDSPETTNDSVMVVPPSGESVVVGKGKKGKDEEEPAKLIKKGEKLFFNETFGGNGRTCGTCHRAENNFTIDASFIATLPDDDPLFVAEFNPDLNDLEKPQLMRAFGLILENVDGFDKPGVMRGVPHVLALRTSVDSRQGCPPGPPCPRTGWSGDGAPSDDPENGRDGSLRAFTIGAVIQHFPKTLDRVAGTDFRLPTDKELDALEAFQLSLGRQADLDLTTLELKGVVPKRGQEIFRDNGVGKCNFCHANAGANASFFPGAGNFNFNTGVEDLPDQPADLFADATPGLDPPPADDGFGVGVIDCAGVPCGFNTPSLVEAADTGPFFHDNSITTIEGAVAFYNSAAFNNSPSAAVIPGGGIDLETTQIEAVAAFLRVINSLENIRITVGLLQGKKPSDGVLERALSEMEDGIGVLEGGGLHPDAVSRLETARKLIEKRDFKKAIAQLEQAKALLIVTP